MTRTDIHAPSSPDFDPEAYRLVDVYDLQDVSREGSVGPTDNERYQEAIAELATRGISCGSATYGCGHCGQTNIRYAALLVHESARQWIVVGQDCLSHRFQDMTAAQFKAVQKRAAESRAQQKLLLAFRQLCEQHPALAYATYSDNISFTLRHEARELGLDRSGFSGDDHLFASGLNWGLNVLVDIARKARKYSSISERQVQLIERILGEQETKWQAYLDRVAERAANPVGPAPTGRQAVEGTVLSVKIQDTDFGSILKVTVKLDNGSRVYGTLPAAVSQADKGDRIAFTATFSASDEPDFAWFSRPTKATFPVAAAA